MHEREQGMITGLILLLLVLTLGFYVHRDARFPGSLVGGVLGCLLALPINGITTSTTNWSSFSEVAFAFRVTPLGLILGMLFAIGMGVIGGLLPARKAASQTLASSLRAT